MQHEATHDTRATDSQLLGQFARTGCDRSFAGLVERYVNLVYSAAHRQLGRHEQAEDVTQRVWMVLARKAPALPEGTVLPAWLLQTTRNLCMDLRKAETRRRSRERKAAEMSRTVITADAEPQVDEQLAGMIDDALASLSRPNRDVIVLRFFEGHSTGEVADRLGLSAAAARQRIARAIGQLRTSLRRRGAGASSASLLALLSSPGCRRAPHAVTSWLAGFSRVAGGLRLKGPAKTVVKLWETAKARPLDVAVAAAGVALIVALIVWFALWVHHNVVWDYISG